MMKCQSKLSINVEAAYVAGLMMERPLMRKNVFHAFVLLPNLVLPLPNLSLENAMSLEKTVSRKVKKKLRNGIGKQLYRDALQLRCG